MNNTFFLFKKCLTNTILIYFLKGTGWMENQTILDNMERTVGLHPTIHMIIFVKLALTAFAGTIDIGFVKENRA